MSTNYYLDDPSNESGHLGKWSAGRFVAKAPEGVNTYREWVERLQGHRIFSECGLEFTPEEMLVEIEPTPEGRHNLGVPRPGEWIENGIRFVRYDFC